jgi:hypothetical protein
MADPVDGPPVEVYGGGTTTTTTAVYTPQDLGSSGGVSTAPPAIALPASANPSSSSGPFASYGNLSSGWKIVYGLIAIGLFIWIAQTRFAPVAVALLVAGIIYEIVK